MAAMLIARFGGDVERLKEAYDRGHALILSRGGGGPVWRAAPPLCRQR